MTNKEKNFVSAVVYVHDAEDRIQTFLKAVIDVLDSNFEHSEIVCVNDHSADNSLKEIKKLYLIKNMLKSKKIHSTV